MVKVDNLMIKVKRKMYKFEKLNELCRGLYCEDCPFSKGITGSWCFDLTEEQIEEVVKNYEALFGEINTKETKAEAFLREYKDLCKKYNISLSHEDGHGAFILENYDEDNIEWVSYAIDDREVD